MILYEDITLADLQAAQAAGTLKTGVIYRVISGSNNFTAGGELFEVQAISATQLANTGTGIFQNCDWQNVGDYSDVFALTGFNPVTGLGMWQTLKGTLPYDTLVGTIQLGATITGTLSAATGIVTADTGSVLSLRALTNEFQVEPITGVNPDATTFSITSTGTVTYTFNPQQGDVVIGWGGAGSNYWGHYQKITTTNIFIDPVTDAGTNYTFLSRDGSKYGYVEEVNEITYDIVADILEERYDPSLFNKLQGNLYTFPYGNISFNQITQIGVGGNFMIKNPFISISECSLSQSIGITIEEDSNAGFANLQINNSVTLHNNIGSISQSRFESLALVNNNKGAIQNAMFFNSCFVTNNGDILLSNFKQAANIDSVRSIDHFTFEEGCTVNGQSIYGLSYGCIAAGKLCTLIADHSYESIYSNSSTMSAVYDAQANEALGVLTILPNYGYIGIFKPSTTPANPITAFTGEIPSDHPFTFAPAAGETIIFTTTAVGAATAGQIISNAVAGTSFVLNGSNGDTAVFQLLANGLVQFISANVSQ